ncbi:hypothetical protein HYY74_00915 [Candidatus Woesearchaeota archaeon]|nr:hypothetical protein [Candidatus Woesearchaeota archaeon]
MAVGKDFLRSTFAEIASGGNLEFLVESHYPAVMELDESVVMHVTAIARRLLAVDANAAASYLMHSPSMIGKGAGLGELVGPLYELADRWSAIEPYSAVALLYYAHGLIGKVGFENFSQVGYGIVALGCENHKAALRLVSRSESLIDRLGTDVYFAAQKFIMQRISMQRNSQAEFIDAVVALSNELESGMFAYMCTRLTPIFAADIQFGLEIMMALPEIAFSEELFQEYLDRAADVAEKDPYILKQRASRISDAAFIGKTDLKAGLAFVSDHFSFLGNSDMPYFLDHARKLVANHGSEGYGAFAQAARRLASDRFLSYFVRTVPIVIGAVKKRGVDPVRLFESKEDYSTHDLLRALSLARDMADSMQLPALDAYVRLVGLHTEGSQTHVASNHLWEVFNGRRHTKKFRGLFERMVGEAVSVAERNPKFLRLYSENLNAIADEQQLNGLTAAMEMAYCIESVDVASAFIRNASQLISLYGGPAAAKVGLLIAGISSRAPQTAHELAKNVVELSQIHGVEALENIVDILNPLMGFSDEASARLVGNAVGLYALEGDVLQHACQSVLEVCRASRDVAEPYAEKTYDLTQNYTVEGMVLIGKKVAEIAARDPETAKRFLQSGTEMQGYLMEKMPAVYLEYIRPVLSRYLAGLLGFSPQVEPGNPRTDGLTIYLPPRIGYWGSRSANFLEYKMLGTHEAAHIAYGSFDFSLGRMRSIVKMLRERYAKR